MGADRLKKIRDQVERGWNKAGKRPSQPTLFDVDPIFVGRAFHVRLQKGIRAKLGDELLLQSVDSVQVVTRGPELVGDCPRLPAAIADALNQPGRVACVQVIGVGENSNTLEVAIHEAKST